MARHFSIPKVLRMTPKALLREFFERLGHPSLCMNGPGLSERQVEPLLTTIGRLPQQAQDEIEAALSAIFELACTSGAHAILEAARRDGREVVALELLDDADPYQRAMWTWLRSPETFNQALLIHQVDHLTRWRKRKGIPRVEPRTTAEAIHKFAHALSHLLRLEEGRGQQCTVEHFRRRDGTDYFVAYPDDFVRTIVMHDAQGNLSPRSLRQTFEIVFGYHRQEGTLELFAKMPSEIKPKLENLFGQVILGVDLGPQNNHLPYNLNRLKDRYFCLDTDPEDRISASIRKLRLDVPDRGRFTVEPLKDSRGSDIYEVIDECLNEDQVAWDEINISLATICFHFEPVNGRRPGSLTCDVTYPDRCSINSRRPEWIDLTRKYLKRWRIAHG